MIFSKFATTRIGRHHLILKIDDTLAEELRLMVAFYEGVSEE